MTTTVPFERRREPRQDIGSELVELDPGNGGDAIGCLLWDASVRGVRLILPVDIELANVVYVIVNNVAKPARVIWRNKTDVGMEFFEEE